MDRAPLVCPLCPRLRYRRAADAAAPADTFRDLSHAILASWNPPGGSEGSEITLRFGLTGRGELRGPPMVTYSRLIGPSALQQAFALSTLRAIAQCTPVSLTDGLDRSWPNVC